MSTWEMGTRKAADNGYLGVLQQARDNGCRWHERTCILAARKGHLELLQRARNNGCPWDEETVHGAAYDGHLETCSKATWSGNLDVLQWVRDSGCPWNEDTYSQRVRKGMLRSFNGQETTDALGFETIAHMHSRVLEQYRPLGGTSAADAVTSEYI
ncbi:unnamed protein product [Ectocarpus sp. CCAP 1310/34]|nr:unnamed protein product [Ectocarpus sp. CCAP 1310/34]